MCDPMSSPFMQHNEQKDYVEIIKPLTDEEYEIAKRRQARHESQILVPMSPTPDILSLKTSARPRPDT
jgi:hypothetical protein